MASIAMNKQTKEVTIQFVLARRRKSIWLGQTTKRDIALWKRHIEELVSAKKIGRAPYDDTAEWVAGLDDELHRKLSGKAGLAEPRQLADASPDGPGDTLAAFLDGYIAKQSDKKRSTIVCLTQCRNDLVEFFEADKALADITEGDAEDWRQFLRTRKTGRRSGRQKLPKARASKASYRDRDKPKQDTPKQLQENTIRRRCGRARQLFQAAVRHRLIARNPFAELKGVSVLANKSRDYFVTRDEATKVLKACPDAQWELLFALSRYGGLRCPSEHLALQWADIDWERGRIVVRSPKTEHHEGKASRVIPLFPELRPYLEKARDDANPGIDVPFSSPVITRYRDANSNLRTQLCRILDKAGVKQWPKLFQNLRASRATELAAEHPGHVAAEWLGHSTLVAQKHYWQVTDDDFERAASKTPANLHYPMQPGAESSRTDTHRAETKPEIPDDSANPQYCTHLATTNSGRGGSRTIAGRKADLYVSTDSLASAYALFPDLQAVVDSWPELSEEVRRGIVAMIEASRAK